MNILFLIGTYPSYGGTEKITTVLANYFAINNKVFIASFEQPKPELASELKDEVQLYNLAYPVVSYKNCKRLKSIIESNNIDIIINQWCLPFYTTLLCNLVRNKKHCKLISVLHGIPDKSKKVLVAHDSYIKQNQWLLKAAAKFKVSLLNKIIQQSIRYVYKNSDSYVVLSKGFKKSFQDYTKLYDTPKLISIGNPITISANYDKDVLTHKKNQILYVGRLDFENKRVNRIVEAWEEVSSDYLGWELILVGDGPHREELEKYVKARNIKRVNFEGFVKEEPVKYYKEASVLMLTSDLEGFGLVIIEGMSYGVVPLVYGSYVSVYDIIDHGENGYITSYPYSKEQTVNYLRDLIENEETRNKMAYKALVKAKTFTLESVTQQWEQLFASLINKLD